MPKRDLYFSKPLINAAGMLGFRPDFRSLQDFGNLELGAFVTNPLSLRPRKPTTHPDVLEYPGGFLLHTGLPNPGFSAAVRQHTRHWQNADLPVIVHLMADRPEETARMVERLEGLENVMAAELGFAPLLADDILLITLEMCLGELPLIVNLPREQVLALGPRLVDAGAAAVSLAAPRGATPLPSPHLPGENGGRLITGRLYGPGLFPQSLETVYQAARIGLPVIGAGGVYGRAQAEAMLEAGALAVQLDAVLWRGEFTENF
jgi:dihydroorotate dehydrogenase (NAD+) catalytic subunit